MAFIGAPCDPHKGRAAEAARPCPFLAVSAMLDIVGLLNCFRWSLGQDIVLIEPLEQGRELVDLSLSQIIPLATPASGPNPTTHLHALF